MKKFFQKTHIHPSFFLFVLYFIITGKITTFLCFFVAVLMHEFGHYFIAKKRGYKLDNFYLAPYGACLNYKDKVFESKDEILIAFAGPFVNFSLSILLVCVWWIFPVSYNVTYDFVFQSIMLGLINLLPCYPLDGGRIAVGLLSNSLSRNKSIKILKVLNIVFAIIFFVIFVVSCFINFNPSFALISAFLVLGNFEWGEEGKYKINIIKKRAKNFSKPMFIYVNDLVTLKELLRHLEQNKFTIFVVLFSNGKTKFVDEKLIQSLALNFPLTASLNQIFTQGKA